MYKLQTHECRYCKRILSTYSITSKFIHYSCLPNHSLQILIVSILVAGLKSRLCKVDRNFRSFMGASSLGLGSIHTMVSLCKFPALDVMKDLPKDQVKIPEQLLCGAVGPNGRDLPQAPKARLFKSASSQASPLKQSKASKAGSLLTLLGEVFEAVHSSHFAES